MSSGARGLTTGLMIALAACGPARPNPVQPSSGRGLDEEGVAALRAVMDELVEAGNCPGYVVLLARDGVPLATLTGGVADLATGRPMTPTTPVRIASMTKPVTAVAALQLVERGRLRLDQPASDFIPELAGMRVAVSHDRDENGDLPTVPLERPITLHDLLTHTSGLGYDYGAPSDLQTMYVEADIQNRDLTLEEAIQELAALPLYEQPGTFWRYSFALDVVGRVVEVAAEQPLQDYLEEHIFEPLGMDATGFPLGQPPEGLPPIYMHDEDGQLVPSTELDLVEGTWASGGGGLVSTGEDFLRFALMLAGEGELDGTRILGAEWVRQMRSDQLTEVQRPERGEGWFFGAGHGYGVSVTLEAFPEVNAERGTVPGDFGWGGAYDTLFRVSPSTGLVGVMMTQVFPGPHLPQRNEQVWLRHLHDVIP
jgi:CubicO group peptidase (beta-lactamase class C family)